MNYGEYDIYLDDDGTMDTVVKVRHPRWKEPQTFRYGNEEVWNYRNPETGCLDEEAFFNEVVIPDAEMEE